MISTEAFIQDCLRIRRLSPLVHNITNYVAMTPAANALLAIGASPLMSFYTEEMKEIAGLSSALAINIGCLDSQQIEAMLVAAREASGLGKPWVLDPVGAGASQARTQICRELISLRPSVIRGNASEISCLAAALSLSDCLPQSRGVDSVLSSDEAVEAARALAGASGSVVSMSGATDYITDGERVESIRNGDPIMSRVTVMGCIATALTAAFLSVDSDAFAAALHAMALSGIAGQKAAAQSGGGTGTFAVRYLDVLSTFDPASDSLLIRQ